MPGRERVTMLAGRLIREAVLQQNALSRVDASCPAARAAALAGAVLDVVDRCQALIEAGADAAMIEEQDFSPILRAREDAATADSVRGCHDTVLATLADVARPAGREHVP